MKDLKLKIVNIVEKYAKDNPKDIELMRSQMIELRGNLKDSKFGKASNEDGKQNMAIERALYEIPEDLFKILVRDLEQEEQEQLSSKDMARWFANEFPLFRIPDKI